MSNALTVENMLRVLPDILRNNTELYALAVGFAETVAKLAPQTDKARIYTRIDTLDEQLLDILAVDFKVDWWDPNAPLDKKRKVFKESWSVHKSLGTKAAVERALTALFEATTVTEWFEYGGDPFTFRVSLLGANPNPELHAAILRAVEITKNARSHLDRITYTTAHHYTATDCAATYAGDYVREFYSEEIPIPAHATAYTAHAGYDTIREAYTSND